MISFKQGNQAPPPGACSRSEFRTELVPPHDRSSLASKGVSTAAYTAIGVLKSALRRASVEVRGHPSDRSSTCPARSAVFDHTDAVAEGHFGYRDFAFDGRLQIDVVGVPKGWFDSQTPALHRTSISGIGHRVGCVILIGIVAVRVGHIRNVRVAKWNRPVTGCAQCRQRHLE
jgi:hypothetical protein